MGVSLGAKIGVATRLIITGIEVVGTTMVLGVTVGLAGIAFWDWSGELAAGGVMGAVVKGAMVSGAST